MKKLIFYFLSLVLMFSMVMAVPMPHPIYGKITHDGYPVSNVAVIVTNTVDNARGESTTTENGLYLVDLGNIDERYRDGDLIKVTLKHCQETPECSKTVVVSGGSNKLSWDIGVEKIQLPPEVMYQCADGNLVDNLVYCLTPEPTPTPTPEPVVITETITEVVCEDGSKVSDVSECPVKSNTPYNVALGLLGGLLTLAIGVLAKFRWGKGFVGLAKYYQKLGDEAQSKGDTELAAKYYLRSAKMLSSALKRDK